MSSETLNRAQALAAAVFWGASFVATKAALREIHPVTLIVLRFGLGVLVLAFAVWRMGIFRKVTRRDLVTLAVLGAISITIHQGLQATGLEFTSASSMAWLVALSPVFTAILALLLLSEPFGAIKILGLAIAFAGAVLVVTKGTFSSETLRLPSTTGDLLATASALNWAIFSVASKPMLKRLPPTLMMAYVMFIGWLLTLPFFAMGQNWNEIPRLTIDGWLAIGFLGIFCSGLAYIFWYAALSNIEASQVAAFIYIEPLVTVVVAAVLLGEPITIITLLGGVTILVGVYLVNKPIARPAMSEVRIAGD
ncbi:MAG: DMT family transporter [Chloroflexi bacterium]|nr:DMT family transporter [Chloroflexota bacterium]